MSHRCPTCQKEFHSKVPGDWPFCSPRCKQIDFGRWVYEDYRIAGPSANPACLESSSDQLDADEDET